MHWERREMVHHALHPNASIPPSLTPQPLRHPLCFKIFIQPLTWCQGTNLHQLFQKSDTTNRLRADKSLQVFLLETNHCGIHELVNFCLQPGPCWFPICNANNPYGRFDVQEMFSLAKYCFKKVLIWAQLLLCLKLLPEKSCQKMDEHRRITWQLWHAKECQWLKERQFYHILQKEWGEWFKCDANFQLIGVKELKYAFVVAISYLRNLTCKLVWLDVQTITTGWNDWRISDGWIVQMQMASRIQGPGGL